MNNPSSKAHQSVIKNRNDDNTSPPQFKFDEMMTSR